MPSSTLVKLAAAVLVVALVAVIGAPVRAVHAYNICGTLYTIDYYSDPGKTHLVGGCTHACGGGQTCWGQQTSYYKIINGHCFVC
jgi:hypothetical protein